MNRVGLRTAVLVTTILVLGVGGGAITLPHGFSPGEVLKADDLNANFAALADAVDPLEGFVVTLSSSACASGTAVNAVGADGTPSCVAVGDGGGGLVAVAHDATLAGDGTGASPLTLARQGATDGQVLRWNGTGWTPAAPLSAGAGLSLAGDLLSVAAGGVSATMLAGGAVTSSKVRVPLVLNATSSKGLEVNGAGGGIANATLRTTNTNGGVGAFVAATRTGASDTVLVVSQKGDGPLLKAFGRNGGNEEIQIDTNGTVYLFKPGASSTADFNIRLDNLNGHVAAVAFDTASDRAMKEGFASVDGGEVLRRVAALPIETWSFRDDHGAARHLGPTAQDFRATFGLGDDDRHIATVDADGVALVAIQALYRENRALEAALAALEARLAALEPGREPR